MTKFPSQPSKPDQLETLIRSLSSLELSKRKGTRLLPSLMSFVPKLSPRLNEPQHLAPFVEILERSAREPVRALVSVPPRHGKTELIMHAVAWLLRNNPHETSAYVSYAQQFANSKSGQMRQYALNAGVELQQGSDAKHEWRTTAGGGLLATGIGGPLTGHGVHHLFIDDPTKNREEAESAVIRERNAMWFTSTATTRVEPGGSIIVCHTRWHPNDLIGDLYQDGKRWERICLPAIDEQGQALWPEQWPLELLNERRSEVGEYDWASMFQGEPRPRGATIFGDPARFDLYDHIAAGWRVVIGVDPAASQKTHADYSVIVVMAAKDDERRILAVYREQMETPALARKCAEVQAAFGYAPLAIETNGVGKAVPQILREIDPTLKIHEVVSRADKFTRAQPLSAAWNAGRVLVPTAAPWVREYLSEMQNFTGMRDAHDDQVDATTHAFDYLTRHRLDGVGTKTWGQRLMPTGGGF